MKKCGGISKKRKRIDVALIMVPDIKPFRLRELSVEAMQNMVGVAMANPPSKGEQGGCSCAYSPIVWGKVITVGTIREYFAAQNGADFTEPITAGIFVSIAAWASYQRTEEKTPYWRTMKRRFLYWRSKKYKVYKKYLGNEEIGNPKITD